MARTKNIISCEENSNIESYEALGYDSVMKAQGLYWITRCSTEAQNLKKPLNCQDLLVIRSHAPLLTRPSPSFSAQLSPLDGIRLIK